MSGFSCDRDFDSFVGLKEQPQLAGRLNVSFEVGGNGSSGRKAPLSVMKAAASAGPREEKEGGESSAGPGEEMEDGESISFPCSSAVLGLGGLG